MEKDTLRLEIWNKIIGKLNKDKFPYVLVGGAALVVYGIPRTTLDIDIYVPARADIVHKLFRIAGSLGLKSGQRAILSIAHSPDLFLNQWICFSHRGQDILDVFLAPEDEFNKLFKDSEQKKDKAISVRVASLRDIQEMKKASLRPIDRADLELIKEVQKIKYPA